MRIGAVHGNWNSSLDTNNIMATASTSPGATPLATTHSSVTDRLSSLLHPGVGASKAARDFLENWSEDAYFRFTSGGPARGQLPPLDWTPCRKAYTIWFWMRPHIIGGGGRGGVEQGVDGTTVVQEDGDPPLPPEQQDTSTTEETLLVERYLYRFFTNDNNVGVAVSCSQWVQTDVHHVQTTLTASTYDASMQAGHSVVLPLTLKLRQWSLVSCTHVFPYLKRPQWSLCVNGTTIGVGDLPYPQTNVMDSNTLWQNLVVGGVLCATNTRTRETNNDASASASSITTITKPLVLDVAACSIYPSQVSPALQAVLCEAGVTFATQSPTPWLPPIANWAKGSSIEAGPKVGIPLAVHPSAPQLQQLAGTLLVGVSASHAQRLGDHYTTTTTSSSSTTNDPTQPQQQQQHQQIQQRLVCPIGATGGNTSDSPRVGLVQPTPPLRYPPDETPVLYLSGYVQLVQSPLSVQSIVSEQDQQHAYPPTSGGHASILWEPVASYAVLPFFLSLCPPGVMLETHYDLYEESIQILYQLYSTKSSSTPSLASQLILLLTKFIEVGGARAVEVVLQDGLLHTLASCLRLSLLRAQKGRILNTKETPTLADVQRRLAQQRNDETSTLYNNSKSVVSPKFIPTDVVQACCQLVAVCCGPASNFMSDLAPHECVRRTSDVALTAMFGFALEVDLWGGDAAAAAHMLQTVADRYGGFCVTLGYILRSQVSVQFFLDTVRLQTYSNFAAPNNTNASALEARQGSELDHIARHQTRLVTAMLMASLSNRRSISQGEHDVASCMNALSDCPLGSMGAHVVLNAIISVLVWCDVLPVEAAPWATLDLPPQSHLPDAELKMQVASRLGRNLLISQFHDVVAPMILSRTVFAAEATTLVSSASATLLSDSKKSPLSWESHWQQALLLFSWLASIAGPDGLIAAKSCGSLLLASGLAGSLEGALTDAATQVISALFLPPLGMAMMVGTTLLHDWSYTDLLSDRLGIMMPLLPGLVVSLLSHPSYSTSDTRMSRGALLVLAELLTAMGGAFHRVFGGVIHQTEGLKSQVKSRRDKSADSVKAAKTHVPPLLVAALFLEKHIRLRRKEKRPVTVSRPEVSRARLQRIDLESWVEISSSESVINEVVVRVPADISDEEVELTVLHDCEKCVLNTAAGLISNAMNLGGAGAAISLWNHVLSTLEETVAHTRTRAIRTPESPSALSEAENSMNDIDSSPHYDVSFCVEILSRLISIVLTKALKRHDQWEVWSYELSSSVAKVCLLIEEKNLLGQRRGSEGADQKMSDDQILLLSTLLEVLAYGRDATGWCQLSLPAMSNSFSDGGKSTIDLSAASKLLLPALEPCFRVVLSSVSNISSHVDIEIVATRSEAMALPARQPTSTRKESLLSLVITELDLTLTAGIVGRSFSAARDMALTAMAALRAAATSYLASCDPEASSICRGLIQKVAEELRVRYEGERRLRENALFDAYEGDVSDGAASAAEEANVIERMILGGDLFGADENDHNEEISFESRKSQVSEDFILFHEPQVSASASPEREKKSRLGYAQYEGLGASLEECKMLVDTAESHDELVDKILVVLGPYLDAWDTVAREDATENELVDLFGSTLKTGISDGSPSKAGTDAPSFAIIGSESAADAMSAFFEFAASEKSRLMEISVRFLPSQRHSRMAFAERFCWARYMEISSAASGKLWERGVSDGNRDIRSRIPTVPCAPQFRRFIPKYLDHYSDAEEQDGEAKGDNEASMSSIGFRRSSIPGEIDAFTKSLLLAGNLEIVDITKKEIDEEEEPELPLRLPSGSVDDYDLTVFNDVSDMEPTQDTDMKQPAVNPIQDEAEEDDVQPDESSNAENGPLLNDLVGKGHHSITTSAFSTPPDNASSSLSLLHSAAAGMIELHMDNCLHVKAEGSRHCTLLLTSTHLVLEYEGDPEGFYEGEVLAAKEDADRQKMIKDAGEYKESGPEEVFQQKSDRRQRDVAALRPKSIRWNLSEVSHVYLRRYRLRDSSLEMFFIPSGGTSFGGYGMFSPSSSLFLDFGPGHDGNRRRDDAAFAVMNRVPPQAIKQWPDRSVQFLHDQLSRLTVGWVEGRITNFDYLLHLNMLSGRSYNDICQYPVFPWVLADYTSSEVPDLTDKQSFRDLSKPVGALNPDRLKEFIERFSTFADPSIPPFMYGSHYSTSAGVVLHFLVRLHPFAGLHRQLQSGHFDVADRLFSSIPRTWSMCTGTSAAEVKELTPEFYCNPTFLKNVNNFKLGTSQDGDVLGDVALPPWAEGSPERFVEIMRAALESEVCSDMLPDWIDLIFGKSQQGPEAIKANNVFFYLTYYGSVDVASIEDEGLRQATELQIAHFGQCPMQLLRRPHVRRIPREYHRLSFYQLLSPHAQLVKAPDGQSDRSKLRREPLFLPFFSAPLSHWVHLDAPPPGPHAALVAVRFAGADRCLAVDAKGIFHTFRWAWRSEEETSERPLDRRDFDLGCFVAQRELPRFRSVPRLMYDAPPGQTPAVAISKTLFAGRSVLLVLSDGDGCGGFGMQLVDPAKGSIRGEVMVPAAHASRITCIATDPIGTAAGHGGVGGELALVGSDDGSASLWRFMSSHYLPLRPRLCLRGQPGIKISAVALCSGSFLAATLTADRCCLYSLGNGTLMRCFGPPENTLDFTSSEDTTHTTTFADTPALGVSVQGFVVTVCETVISPKAGPERKVIMLHLFTVEGVSLGSKPLESWRGLPHKMHCTPDGTAVLVCCGRGITVHRLSACDPLEILDEWQITEADSLGRSEPMDAAYDIDLGPSLNRPVVAAAACSNGVLRLHALPGISSWSERNRKSGLTQTVGTALAKPAQRLNRVMREGIGFGRQLAGMGREIGKEVTTDVKEKGVTGFFGNLLQRPKNP